MVNTKLTHPEVSIKMNAVLTHYTAGTTQYDFMNAIKERLNRVATTMIEPTDVFEAIKAEMAARDSLGCEKSGKIAHRLFPALFGMPNPLSARMGELHYRNEEPGQSTGHAAAAPQPTGAHTPATAPAATRDTAYYR